MLDGYVKDVNLMMDNAIKFWGAESDVAMAGMDLHKFAQGEIASCRAIIESSGACAAPAS